MATPCKYKPKSGKNYNEFVCTTCGEEIAIPSNVNYDDLYIYCANGTHPAPVNPNTSSYTHGKEKVKFSTVMETTTEDA